MDGPHLQKPGFEDLATYPSLPSANQHDGLDIFFLVVFGLEFLLRLARDGKRCAARR
eukprot:CAMPEP_0206361482 /NCGR_PEP_ID=MMETSP0294-20121207/386_1 /ASSEMBLY_ACC=CAM_ASM_000327 /TAXON_ID=39354 /ORGANISM="Heterosigma akashiwo, Strain CCMP2393" /LENGTH=56 /DNA_ID=CAMNT_0053806371 /DNA_START=466 /DNA_END=633 /DNA_ORIENTATION=-